MRDRTPAAGAALGSGAPVQRKLHPEVADLSAALERLELTEQQRQAITARFTGYTQWLESAATRARRGHYLLRLTAGIGGALIAALAGAEALADAGPAVNWTTFGLGLVVSIALLVDGFFNLGDRWRHYRLAAETLKGAGWRFIQLAEPYHGLTHTQAAPAFTAEVEDFIRAEVTGYISGPAKPAAGG